MTPEADRADGGSLSARREEADLIKSAKRREGAALRALIEAHQERLFAFVWRVVRNHHDAEELCQEAFLKAFASLDDFDTRYRFSTWLFTIAYRLSLNFLRRKRPTGGDAMLATLPSADDVGQETAQSEEARRLKSIIWTAVDDLSAPQRAAMLLFYKQEMSCQEISEVLGTPVATVKSHLHRARARLKDVLERELPDTAGRDRILASWAG